MDLRYYQVEAVDCAWAGVLRRESGLIVMPTGTGKTTCIAELVRRNLEYGRALVIAHTEELIEQIAERIRMWCPGVEVGIEMGDRTCISQSGYLFGSLGAVVASRQSLAQWRRLREYKPEQYSLIIIDEGHHATASQYQKILSYFPNAALVGVTATPDRADGKALKSVYSQVYYEYGLETAWNDGYLLRPRQQFLDVSKMELNFEAARNTDGSFSEEKLDAILAGEPEIAHKIAGSAVEYCPGQTLIFCPGVDLTNLVGEIINRFPGKSAAAVVGSTPKELRREYIEKYKAGELQYLVGCGVFLEGFDAPNTMHLLNTRFFKSRNAYTQMVGRILRPLDGILKGKETAEERLAAIQYSVKPWGHVIDITSSSVENELIFSGDILGGEETNGKPKFTAEARRNAIRKAKAKGTPVDMAELVEREQEIINQREERNKKRTWVRAEVKGELVPISASAGAATNDPTMPTPEQRELLTKAGYDCAGMSRKKAKRLCSAIRYAQRNGTATPKQAQILSRYNIKAKQIPKLTATVLLDCIKANKWKPIDYIPTRDLVRIKKVEGGFRVMVKPPNGNDVVLMPQARPFPTVEEARKYFGDAFDKMPEF